MKTPTQNAAPATTKEKKSKDHQISRSPEARKARRIIRQSLRYAMTTAITDDPDVTEDDRTEASEWLTENEELVQESLDFMASIRRERKAKAEKTKKARKTERKRVQQTEAELDDESDDDDEDSDDEE